MLSETFGDDNDRWLDIYRDIICGYDTVAKLSEEERRAVPYVILANQFVCVAWFAQQDKYADIFQTDKKMTLWLLDKFQKLSEL